MRNARKRFVFRMGRAVLLLMMGIALLYMTFSSFPGAQATSATADGGVSGQGTGDRQAMNAAYADILDEYHDFMFYLESAQQDLGEGKVALRDVYGDVRPELLFVYRRHEGAENLRIYTYDDEKGAVVIFDDMICSFAAGGGNYCLYLTSDDRLMAYYSERDVHFQWGFWDVSRMLGTGRTGNQSTVFQYEPETAALHCDVEMDVEDQPTIRMSYGVPISQAELDQRAKAMLAGIQTVIFQSDILAYDNFDGTFIKAGLYDIEPYFQNIAPFTADFMIWEVARNALRG